MIPEIIFLIRWNFFVVLTTVRWSFFVILTTVWWRNTAIDGKLL